MSLVVQRCERQREIKVELSAQSLNSSVNQLMLENRLVERLENTAESQRSLSMCHGSITVITCEGYRVVQGGFPKQGHELAY